MGFTSLDEKEHKKSAIITSIKDGATITAACKAANISRGTLFNWRKVDEEFDGTIEDAKKSRVSMVEDALFVNALKGNAAAMIFYLKNKGGYKDSPLMEQHTHYVYQWKTHNSAVPAPEVPAGDTRLE